jgi:PAS domain S-box-containing protein
MKKTDHQSQFARLRAKAEELLKTKTEIPSQNNPETDLIKLVSELEVYQIELELQNEELKLAKQRADDAAEKYAKLYDFAPMGYFTLSKEGEILQLNLASAKMLGKERAQLKHSRFGFFVSEDTKPAFNAFLEKVFCGEPNQSSVVTLIRENKELMLVQLTGAITENSEECLVTVSDVTERKRAEDALRESESSLNYAQKITKLGSWDLDLTNHKVTWSKNCYFLYGVKPYEIEPSFDYFKSRVHPDDLHIVEEAFIRLTRNKLPTISEMRITFPDGSIKWFQFNIVPIIKNDSVVALKGVNIDVTERKNAEAMLKNERLRLQGIIEGTNVGTWEWNIQTGETIFNNKYFEMIGYLPEELFPVSIQTWETLVHPDDLKRSKIFLEQHFKGERLYYKCECRMKHKDGSWVWIQDRGRVITRTKEGKPLMMFGTHTDITQEKFAEVERERMIAALQSALADVKTLSGIIPICANCKKVRDDKGYWEQVESYVSHHSNAQFSHGVCPDCVEKLYPEQVERLRNKQKK